nr:SprB repeat-containing protein [Bacteroidota bacterium]
MVKPPHRTTIYQPVRIQLQLPMQTDAQQPVHTVTQPTLLVATCSGTNVTCKGASTGSAAVVASGGTAPYTYLWSNGKTTSANNTLAAGHTQQQ